MEKHLLNSLSFLFFFIEEIAFISRNQTDQFLIHKDQKAKSMMLLHFGLQKFKVLDLNLIFNFFKNFQNWDFLFFYLKTLNDFLKI